MLHRAITILVASLLLVTAASAETDEKRFTGSVDFGYGFKDLGGGWEPLGDQWGYVFSLTLGRKNWPVHVALDYVSAEDEETRLGGFLLIPFVCCLNSEVTGRSKTSEVDLGIRRVWRQDKYFRPYVGGGVAFIDGKVYLRGEDFSADDSTTGYWLDVGFRQTAFLKADWGFDVRYSEGKITLGDARVDAGGILTLFYVGGHW